MAEPTVAPDVMQQFNAIRNRLTGQQPEVETVNTVVPTDTTAPDRRIETTFGKGKLVGYALDNQPRSKAEFEQAYDAYRKVGNRVPGFTFLEPGVVQKLRSGFEAANQPIQESAKAFDQGVGPLSRLVQQIAPERYNQIAAVPNAIRSAVGVGPLSQPQQTLQPNIAGPAQVIASAVDTPEKAAALAAQSLAAGPTAGLNFLPRVAVRTVAAGLGALAADTVTGSSQSNPQRKVSNVLQQTALAAFGEGLVGGFKQLIGRGFSDTAKAQVAKDLMDVIKREAAPFTNDPQALQALSSTQRGANSIITVGIKALRGDIDTLGTEIVEDITARSLNRSSRITDYVKSLERRGVGKISVRDKAETVYTSKAVPGQYSSDKFVTDFNAQSPFSLSKETTTEVKRYVRQLATQGNDLLDNIGDADAYAASQQAMRDTRDKIVTALTAQYSKSSSAIQAAQALRAEQLVSRYTSQLDKFVDVAEVLHYMRQSVGPQGFDPTMMQKLIQYKAGATPGSTLDKAGDAVFRGAADRLAGTDATITKQVPFVSELFKKIPLLNKIPLSADVGTRYVGKVRGTYPRAETAATQATIRGIQDFLEER